MEISTPSKSAKTKEFLKNEAKMIVQECILINPRPKLLIFDSARWKKLLVFLTQWLKFLPRWIFFISKLSRWVFKGLHTLHNIFLGNILVSVGQYIVKCSQYIKKVSAIYCQLSPQYSNIIGGLFTERKIPFYYRAPVVYLYITVRKRYCRILFSNILL